MLGAQDNRGLWRIYPAMSEARTQLLVRGIWVAERAQKLKLNNWLMTLPQFLKNKQDMNTSFTILEEFEGISGL